MVSNKLNEKSEWSIAQASYNEIFDLTKIEFNELCIKIGITNGSNWYFDFINIHKIFIDNQYMNYFNSLISDSITVKYQILFSTDYTVKLHSCYVGSAEYNKSYMVIAYR